MTITALETTTLLRNYVNLWLMEVESNLKMETTVDNDINRNIDI